MSAAGGSSRGKTADELLADILTETEHVAVLKYARDHNLASDDVVYFLLGLLKVFAHVHHQIVKAIAAAEVGRSELETTVNLAGQDLEDKVTDQVAMLKHAFTDMNNIMGYHAAQFASTAGEIKGLKEELEKLNKEAVGTLRTYLRIADDGTGTSLSQAFLKHLGLALDRRVKMFDDTIRPVILDAVERRSHAVMVAGAIQFIILVVLMIVLRR